MRARRGLTLIELMVVLGVSVLLVLSVTFAYSAGVRFQEDVPVRDAEVQRIVRFEDDLRRIFEGAFLTTDTGDDTSYFMTLSSGGDLAVPDTLVFTTLGVPPTSAFTQSQDDFETLNSRFGPQGGLAEVSLSTIPVGDAPVDNALFLRVQRPPDGDPTQGGNESALLQGVASFTFEFFDGTDWVDEWDTLTGQRRLPAAVRVTFRLEGEDQDRTLTFRIPNSDVTPDNPIQQVIGQ
ncbi:MAG TPA: type II secretion system protein GspJ [Fimbriimonadaceae bacterium]|nr:type II secretion system protein GspJ [Fimbriimonadaceae bacterium]